MSGKWGGREEWIIMTLIFQNSLELSSITNLRIKLRELRFSGNNTKIDTQIGDGTTGCSANIRLDVLHVCIQMGLKWRTVVCKP